MRKTTVKTPTKAELNDIITQTRYMNSTDTVYVPLSMMPLAEQEGRDELIEATRAKAERDGVVIKHEKYPNFWYVASWWLDPRVPGHRGEGARA